MASQFIHIIITIIYSVDVNTASGKMQYVCSIQTGSMILFDCNAIRVVFRNRVLVRKESFGSAFGAERSKQEIPTMGHLIRDKIRRD
mmetsp:Transcript_7645/g.22396  ORF Transcript_7645/g.22396 Transcript_7645/m.22396 type:complete len:87 (-) Transcript_7645:213-473(-)